MRRARPPVIAALAAVALVASGCGALSLSAGTHQASTLILGNRVALAAQLSLDAGLAAVSGVRVAAIHQYTFPRRTPAVISARRVR